MTAAARSRHIARGLVSLLVLVAVVVGVPALLLALGLFPGHLPAVEEVRSALGRRDDGQFVLGVLAAGVWLCWALFTVATVQEIGAAARGRQARRWRPLAGFQRPAAQLVSAVVLMFVAAPLTWTAGVTPAEAAAPTTTTRAVSSATTLHETAAPAAKPAEVAAAGAVYKVQRHDNLWSIAEAHLGDGLRWREIRDLNGDRIGPDDRLHVGTMLKLPAGARSPDKAEAEEVTVGPGDTLWEIAEEQLGSGEKYTELWRANQGRPQPDGQELSDPDRLQPGWTLALPGEESAARPPAAGPAHSPGHSSRSTASTPVEVAPPPGDPASAPVVAPSPPAPPAVERNLVDAPPGGAEDSVVADEEQAASPYLSLGAGGALLAGGLLGALMLHRRRQFRHRRPGRVVAGPPDDLVPLERALLTMGGPALDRVTFLDVALRSLAAGATSPPEVLAACLDAEQLQLVLGERPSAGPPPPWRAEADDRWVIDRNAELPLGPVEAQDVLAPYPCLVSVGHTPAGQEWLLDLEHVGSLALRGDSRRCTELARYIAAELSNNSWSDHLTVTLAGFGRELAAADPTRLQHTEEIAGAASQILRSLTANRQAMAAADIDDVLAGRVHGVGGDVWMPQVLLAVAPTSPADEAALEELLAAQAGLSQRSAVAVVVSSKSERSAAARELVIDEDGQAHLPFLGLTVTAHSLPEWLASDLGRAIALARDGEEDLPTPASEGEDPWDAFADAAGALRPDHIHERGPHAEGPEESAGEGADQTSVLPLPTEQYVAAAATTATDVATLAPAVLPEIRSAVEDADRRLDADLADWRDPDSTRPKLRMLGPVMLAAHGRPPEKQAEFCTELVAYIASKRNGVTSDQLAADLWPEKNYTGRSSYPRNLVSRTRHWLGEDEEGQRYLPEASRTGVDTYRLQGVLVDAELFKRLRVRGESRGPDGIDDLLVALELVTGAPLSQARLGGYSWLEPGTDFLYTGMVVDVAHLVTTHFLATGHTMRARAACEVALSTGSSDDIALLDIAATYQAAGRFNEMEATISRILVNNEKKIEEDLPPRTYEVLLRLRQRHWAQRAS